MLPALPPAILPLPAPPVAWKGPDKVPECFAPGMVGTGLPTRDMAVAPDGKAFCFSVTQAGFSQAAILECRWEDGAWTAPEVAPFSRDPRCRTLEPCISPDGQRFYFSSDRPETAGEAPGIFGIWVMERQGRNWGPPRRLPAPVNGKDPAFFPSITRDGTLYYTRDLPDGTSAIFRAPFRNGRFETPERLPPQVNCGTNRFNAYVAPDASYLIVSAQGRKDSLGGTDYYIVFRNGQDRWSQPQNLGAPINSEAEEFSPSVTPDGRWFFFCSSRVRPDRFEPGHPLTFARLKALHNEAGANGNSALYWVRADFITELRRKAVFPES